MNALLTSRCTGPKACAAWHDGGPAVLVGDVGADEGGASAGRVDQGTDVLAGRGDVRDDDAAPSSASRRAVAAPMPDAAPVTTAVRSAKRVISGFLPLERVEHQQVGVPGNRPGDGDSRAAQRAAAVHGTGAAYPVPGTRVRTVQAQAFRRRRSGGVMLTPAACSMNSSPDRSTTIHRSRAARDFGPAPAGPVSISVCAVTYRLSPASAMAPTTLDDTTRARKNSGPYRCPSRISRGAVAWVRSNTPILTISKLSWVGATPEPGAASSCIG